MYCSIIRRPGGGGALQDVVECSRAAESTVTASREKERRQRLADAHARVCPGVVAPSAPRGEALRRRGRVVRDKVRMDEAFPIPIKVAGCGRARRRVIYKPAGEAVAVSWPAAVGVPVEPVG